MTDYIADAERLVYWRGATGSPVAIAGTFPPNGQVDFGWYGNFADPSIRGFKIVLDADGHGDMFWAWDMNNPGYPTPDYPGAPTWTADPTASHIALHNSYDAPASFVHVDGPTHYEWEFTWPGDPTFGGFVFNDPLSDLLISLAAAHSSSNEVSGSLQTQWSNTDTITVSRFDLVLIGIPDGCYTVDLPAYGVTVQPAETITDDLATPDTATSVVFDYPPRAMTVAHYGLGSASVNLPTIPAGYSISNAQYVMTAYRDSATPLTPDPDSSVTPPPDSTPYLYADSSVRPGWFGFGDIPVGSYGEVLNPLTESSAMLELDQPLNRLWYVGTGVDNPAVHIAYLAIRLTICPAKSHPPPLRQFPRSDGYGAGPKRIYPRTPNRRAGKSY